MFIENRGKAITFKGLVRETGSGGTPGGITMHWQLLRCWHKFMTSLIPLDKHGFRQWRRVFSFGFVENLHCVFKGKLQVCFLTET